MLTLVLVLCLNSACREARIQAPDGATPMACLMTAELSAARYLAEHPQMAAWRLRAARCEVGAAERGVMLPGRRDLIWRD